MTKEQVIEVLKTVKDPEILQSIWDLGLVYDIAIEDSLIKIKMTLTTPFCPYGPALLEDVKDRLKKDITGVSEVEVEVVWEPPWSFDKVSPEVKAELGIL